MFQHIKNCKNFMTKARYQVKKTPGRSAKNIFDAGAIRFAPRANSRPDCLKPLRCAEFRHKRPYGFLDLAECYRGSMEFTRLLAASLREGVDLLSVLPEYFCARTDLFCRLTEKFLQRVEFLRQEPERFLRQPEHLLRHTECSRVKALIFSLRT